MKSGTPISGIPRNRETQHPYMIPISGFTRYTRYLSIPNFLVYPDIGVYPRSGIFRYRVQRPSKTYQISGTISGYIDIGYFDSDIGVCQESIGVCQESRWISKILRYRRSKVAKTTMSGYSSPMYQYRRSLTRWILRYR